MTGRASVSIPGSSTEKGRRDAAFFRLLADDIASEQSAWSAAVRAGVAENGWKWSRS
jgi:hypothetical protein